MKIYTLMLVLLCASTYAQNNRVVAIVEPTTNPAAILDELPIPPPRVLGSTYLKDEWIKGEIRLANNKLIKGFPLKYDLRNNVLEIKGAKEVKICQLQLIKDFTLNEATKSSAYVNSTTIDKSNKIISEGICELLLDTSIQLLKCPYTEVKKATYNVALDVGTKDHKILKKSKKFATIDGAIYEIKNGLKKNATVFGNNYNEVKEYIQSNGLKFGNDDDLIEIFKFYKGRI